MPITFGSVGDLICIGLLIKDLVKCLDDTRGSSAEYQAAIRELRSLDLALLEVELMFHSSQVSDEELRATQETALSIAEQCRVCITRFREHMKRYQSSLKAGGSGGIFKDTARKLLWSVLEKEEVDKFRAEINNHCSSVNILIAQAGLKAVQISNENAKRNFKRLKIDQESSSAMQKALIEDLRGRKNDSSREIKAIRTDVQSLRSSIGYVRTIGTEILSFLQRIWNVNLDIYKAVMTIQSRLPAQSKRSCTQEPVTLSDPLGRVTPVHLEFIETWEAFQSVPEVRFRQLPGHAKVQRKEYALEAESSNIEIDSDLTFRRWFLPGRKINMDMVFRPKMNHTVSYPGCKVDSESMSSRIKCHGCGMWYDRIEQVHNDLSPAEATEIADSTPDISPSKKRKRRDSFRDQDEPAQFCPVLFRYIIPLDLELPIPNTQRWSELPPFEEEGCVHSPHAVRYWKD